LQRREELYEVTLTERRHNTEQQPPQHDLLAWSCLELFTGLIKIKPELLPVFCDSANDAIPHAVD
jgi:hypothetical protein